MADTFEEMLNEFVSPAAAASATGQFIKGVVNSKVNGALNKFDHWKAETLGDLKAKGKLDLQDMTQTLMDQWLYFQGQQQVQPSLSSVADFLDTHLGLKLSEESLYRAVYGFNPDQKQPTVTPNGNEPNAVNITKGFRAISNPKITDRNLAVIANQLAAYARADKGDEELVSRYLNYIGSTKPDLLKRPEMSVLGNFAHGGLLSQPLLVKLLTGIAKLILKAQTVAQRGGNAAAGDDQQANTQGQQAGLQAQPSQTPASNNTPNFNPPEVASSRSGLTPPPRDATSPIPSKATLLNTVMKCGLTNRAWNAVQQAGLDRDTKAIEDVVSAFQHGGFGMTPLKVGQINAASARVMQMLITDKSDPKRIQQALSTSGYPATNVIASIDYLKAGGNVDGVVADMNKIVTDPKKASYALANLITADATLTAGRQKQTQTQQPQQQPAAAPAQAQAPAARTAPAAPAAPQGQARP